MMEVMFVNPEIKQSTPGRGFGEDRHQTMRQLLLDFVGRTKEFSFCLLSQGFGSW